MSDDKKWSAEPVDEKQPGPEDERLREMSGRVFEGRCIRLREAFTKAINEASFEGYSNTPDFILAQAALDAVIAASLSARARDRWYNIAPEPGRSDNPVVGVMNVELRIAERADPNRVAQQFVEALGRMSRVTTARTAPDGSRQDVPRDYRTGGSWDGKL